MSGNDPPDLEELASNIVESAPLSSDTILPSLPHTRIWRNPAASATGGYREKIAESRPPWLPDPVAESLYIGPQWLDFFETLKTDSETTESPNDILKFEFGASSCVAILGTQLEVYRTCNLY